MLEGDKLMVNMILVIPTSIVLSILFID